MPRPAASPTADPSARDEVEKWDAWHAQAGTSRTNAKRRYIATLIDTMRTYASTTAEARELIADLSFVWDQISGLPSRTSPTTSSAAAAVGLDFGDGHTMGQLRVLPPQSSDAASDSASRERREVPQRTSDAVRSGRAAAAAADDDDDDDDDREEWRIRVEQSLQRLTAEVAALREELQQPPSNLGINFLGPRIRWRRRTALGWVVCLAWEGAKHLLLDGLLVVLLAIWLRRRGDPRLEMRIREWVTWFSKDWLLSWLSWARERLPRRLGRARLER